jgi:protein-disulfide isomerase
MKDAKTERGGGKAPGAAPSKRGAQQRRPGEPHADHTYDVPVDGRPQQGPDDALVTIVEFSDYHCPFCAQAHETIEAIRKKYPEDVRVVHRQRPLPIHANAKHAAKVALAAQRQGKFEEVHPRLFELKGADLEQIKRAAIEAGLDAEKLDADLADPEIATMIREDGALADHYGSRGTPSFFVNGRFLSGAQSVQTFDSLIQEELGKAKARVESGTPAAGVYEAIRAGAEKEVTD